MNIAHGLVQKGTELFNMDVLVGQNIFLPVAWLHKVVTIQESEPVILNMWKKY